MNKREKQQILQKNKEKSKYYLLFHLFIDRFQNINDMTDTI